MYWNLLSHSWYLLFHTFMIFSSLLLTAVEGGNQWVNIYQVIKNTLPLKIVSTLKMNWTKEHPLKTLLVSCAKIPQRYQKRSGHTACLTGITKEPFIMPRISVFIGITVGRQMLVERLSSVMSNALPALPVTRPARTLKRNVATG